MAKISDEKLQKIIGWSPDTPKGKHEIQEQIISSSARHITVCAGVRGGKSQLAAYLAFKHLLADNQRIWIVSLTYEMTGRIFSYVKEFAEKFDRKLLRGVRERPFPRLEVKEWNSWIECKSTEKETQLMGEELNFAVLDEAARMKADIWERYIMARLSSRQGKSLVISTPFGQNWFHKRYLQTKEDNASFHFSSKDNPMFPPEEWENARNILPQAIFQQEYMAMFLADAAAVFRPKAIENCIQDCLGEPNNPTIMGLDVAKMNDFTVMTVVDRTTHRTLYWDRFQKIPYTLQKERIVNIARKYNSRIVIDALNAGAALADELRAEGLSVYDFKATGTISKDYSKRGSKERLVEKLSTFLESGNIVIPQIPELIDELTAFGYTMTDKGNMTYQAPEGLHDDCFVKGTLILTNKGQVPIENIKTGDLVMTRDGYKLVMMTRRKYKKVISNLNLRGTPEHPVITEKGDIPLTSISNNDILHIWNTSKQKIEKLSFMEAKDIIDIQIPKEDNYEFISGDTLNGKNLRSHYTGKFGLIIMEKYQKALSFITLTMIRLTMILKTFKLCPEASTLPSISEKDLCKNQNAYNAKKYLPFSSIKELNFAGLFAHKGLEEMVYNLQIKDKPEYFANNILVHNCVISLALAIWPLHGKVRKGNITAKRSVPFRKRFFQYR